jgi:2-methylcitrate dehydratase PrpD
VKALHPGWAAHTGIAAVALAEGGMTGPETILEGRFGFLASFVRDPGAAERLTAHLDTLGQVWHLPDAAFKLFPCCHYIHPFLEAMQTLMDGGLSLPKIDCEPWQRRQSPASGYDGKWGLAYCLAALLVDGRVDVATFATPPDAAIVEAARRVTWQPLANHGFPDRFEAVIEVRLSNGESLGQRIESVRGGPERPISEAGVLEKFRTNAARAIGVRGAEVLHDAIMSVDTEPALAPLTKALRQQKT